MTLDVSSFPAYLRSLNIDAAARPRAMVAGPPAPIVELALRLGLGPWILDNPRARQVLGHFGLNSETLAKAAGRLRTRAMWLPVWEALAQPHVERAKRAAATGDWPTAREAVRLAFTMLLVGLMGDGLYFYTPMAARWKTYPARRRLAYLQHKVTQAHTERLFISDPRGHTWGLLHFPPGWVAKAKRAPALVGLHPLSSDKETFDYYLHHFRAAGYATLCVDLPAHGENFHGPRLQPDSEWVGAAALAALARRPDIDPARLGVIGGSLGAFYALRTAAVSQWAGACLAVAAPFDLGAIGPTLTQNAMENFAWVIGARTREELLARSAQFHLRDTLERIRHPVCLVHGTQDSVCDFNLTFAIASRLTAPVAVLPLLGVDHEAAYPAVAGAAEAGIKWLDQTL